MNIKSVNVEKVLGYTLAGAGVLLVGREIKRAVVSAAGDAANAVNPTNPDNVFSQGTNAVGDALDDGIDNNSFSLGAWIWEVLHPDQVKKENELTKQQDSFYLGRSTITRGMSGN